MQGSQEEAVISSRRCASRVDRGVIHFATFDLPGTLFAGGTRGKNPENPGCEAVAKLAHWAIRQHARKSPSIVRMGTMTILPTCVSHSARLDYVVSSKSAPSVPPMRALGPPPLPLLTVPITKRLTRDRLGVSFMPEPVEGGALISALEWGSIAWRANLRPGDIVKSVIIDGEEHPMEGGYRAAQLLRPACGVIRLRVRRRKLTRNEAAARRIQAALRGMCVRSDLHVRRLAAEHIQGAWRRASAMADLADALWAVDVIQTAAFMYVERRRRVRASARRPIRSPPRLE